MKKVTTPVLKIDRNFEIISWNTSAEEFLNNIFKKSPKAQLSLEEIFPPGIWTKFHGDFKTNQGIFHNIYTFSETETIEVFSSPSLDDGGNIKCFSLCLKAVSPKENGSSENIVRLKNILENSSLAIFLSDPSGPIVEVNRAACKLFGYSLRELKRLSREDIIQMNSDLETAIAQRNKAGEIK